MLVRGRNDGSQAAKDVGKVDIKAERVKSLLSMYGEPPSGEIRMEQFEAYSIDRLMGTYRQPAVLGRLAPRAGGFPRRPLPRRIGRRTPRAPLRRPRPRPGRSAHANVRSRTLYC